jgi:hypothetical protein
MSVSALDDFRALNRMNVAAIVLDEENGTPTLGVFLRGEGLKAAGYGTPQDAAMDGARLMKDFPGFLVVRETPLLALNSAMTDSSIEVGRNCYITFKGTTSVLQLPHKSWPEAKALSDRINSALKHAAKGPVAVRAEGNVVQLFRKPGL